MATTILIPLINPNEPDAVLAILNILEGQPVQKGDVLAILETTKSTAEMVAETGGYVAGLRLQAGQMVHSGDLLCYLAESPDWQPGPAAPASQTSEGLGEPGESPIPPGLRISQPALTLALEHHLDLARLPRDRFITEAIVREEFLIGVSLRSPAAPEAPFDPAAMIIYGGGGHGKSLIELVRLAGRFTIIGVVDDGLPAGEQILGLPVLGGSEMLGILASQGVLSAVNAVGGIGIIETRIKVFERLQQAGFSCPAVVHPTAFLEPSARLADGVQVFPHAYVGSEAWVGFGCIINTGAVVSHDCQIEDYANISPGALLAGEVRVGYGALIGMGATINLRVNIGAHARVGNSAAVKSDVPERTIVRAGTTWPG